MRLVNQHDLYNYLVVAQASNPRNTEYYKFRKTENGSIIYDQFRGGKWYKDIVYYGDEQGLFRTVRGWPCIPYDSIDYDPLSMKIKEMSTRFENRKQLKEANVKNSSGRTMSFVSVEW